MQEQEVIAPASIPQELFINSDADITVFKLNIFIINPSLIFEILA